VPCDSAARRSCERVRKCPGSLKCCFQMDGQSPSRANVLALYGEAMVESQRLEQSMVGLLGVRAELDAAAREDWDEFGRAQQAWERLFSVPAGRLRQRLALEGELGDELELAIHARNSLAHHYLRDRQWELDRAYERQGMAASLRETVDRFRALASRLDDERQEAMAALGLTDDHITTPDEARLYRYWDPSSDDYVAPELWEAT
jgi:hypothetical protein